jgi:ATP-dependent DNA helicase PIF1
MKALSGEIVTYKADDWPAAVPGKSANTYLSNFMAPERLALKVGAQVMLVKNMDTLLVNGTIGVVVGFGVAEFEYSDNEEDTTQQSNKKAKVLAGVAQGTEELAPRIEWRIPGGGTETKLMAREEFKVENEKKELLARRRQVRSRILSRLRIIMLIRFHSINSILLSCTPLMILPH